MGMLVKYSPEDNQAQNNEWEFDPNRVRQSEAELIEKRSGLTWDKWLEAIQAGSAAGRRVLLWHLLRREHHTLRLEDTPDFYMGELEIEYSLADLQKLRAQVEESSVDDGKKADILDRLDLEIASRLGKEEVGPEDMGKAPSEPGD
jgi:hypothetical protein